MAAPNKVIIGAAAGSLAAAIALATPNIQKWEGLRLDPYFDIAGVPTVCWGETLNVENRRYTREECDAMLAKSIERHARPIMACLPESAPIHVKAAFVSFGYNVGVTAACNSSAARHARNGNYRAACDAMMMWTKVRSFGGQLVESQGLRNRREDERRICLVGTLRRAA